ncbi:MAG: amidohydrolase, partial [Pseudomonadota bacterium]|nr:amidohydrolase [Pseudomonadota bacterium]
MHIVQPYIGNIASIKFIILFLIASCTQETNNTLTPDSADLVLHNGAIYTVDENHSWAQSIAIKDGKIVYVGSDAGAEEFIGSKTRTVDLKAKMVMPGMQDVHIHP